MRPFTYERATDARAAVAAVALAGAKFIRDRKSVV